MARFNRYIVEGDQHDQDGAKDKPEGGRTVPLTLPCGLVLTAVHRTPTKGKTNSKAKGKGKAEHVFNLTGDIHAAESIVLKDEAPAHRYEVPMWLLSPRPLLMIPLGHIRASVVHRREVCSLSKLPGPHTQ